MNGKLKQSAENIYENGFLFVTSTKWQTNCHNRKWAIFEYWFFEAVLDIIQFSMKRFKFNIHILLSKYPLTDKLDSHESSFIVLMIARGHTMYDIMKVI